jgi:hypothetical protein
VQQLPRNLQRLAAEIDGWLDLRCPDKALERMAPLLADPAAHAAGLAFRVRALIAQAEHRKALDDLVELRRSGHDAEWCDLTEAWCLKRTGDLPGAIQRMRDLLARTPRSPIGHFNLGCYLALAGERDAALDEVTVACGLDDSFREIARDEPDLVCLDADPRFQALLQKPAAGGTATAEDPPEDILP